MMREDTDRPFDCEQEVKVLRERLDELDRFIVNKPEQRSQSSWLVEADSFLSWIEVWLERYRRYLAAFLGAVLLALLISGMSQSARDGLGVLVFSSDNIALIVGLGLNAFLGLRSVKKS